jgi:hypothetical protein
MNQFEYLIPFVGIIYALSATDLLVSVHRLIIDRKTITFHVVPIIWAIEAFLLIINGWWGFLDINNKIVLENAGQLFLLSLLPLVLFLIASLSLPHKVKNGLSLWEYFNAHKVPFYLSHMAYFILIPIVLGSFADEQNVMQTLKLLGLASVFLCLIWLKHWGWHLAASSFFMLGLLGSIFSQSI